MNKILKIFTYAIPVLIMIGLIRLVTDDYVLTLLHMAVIFLASLILKFTKSDTQFLILGFVIMTISEYVFISIGVEKFLRKSLFGVMPLWLPFLWAYGFVAIKKSGEVMNHKF